MTLSVTLTDQEFLDALRYAFMAGVNQVTGQPFDRDEEATKHAKASIAEYVQIRLAGLDT